MTDFFESMNYVHAYFFQSVFYWSVSFLLLCGFYIWIQSTILRDADDWFQQQWNTVHLILILLYFLVQSFYMLSLSPYFFVVMSYLVGIFGFSFIGIAIVFTRFALRYRLQRPFFYSIIPIVASLALFGTHIGVTEALTHTLRVHYHQAKQTAPLVVEEAILAHIQGIELNMRIVHLGTPLLHDSLQHMVVETASGGIEEVYVYVKESNDLLPQTFYRIDSKTLLQSIKANELYDNGLLPVFSDLVMDKEQQAVQYLYNN